MEVSQLQKMALQRIPHVSSGVAAAAFLNSIGINHIPFSVILSFAASRLLSRLGHGTIVQYDIDGIPDLSYPPKTMHTQWKNLQVYLVPKI